jgi:hypothetical protein
VRSTLTEDGMTNDDQAVPRGARLAGSTGGALRYAREVFGAALLFAALATLWFAAVSAVLAPSTWRSQPGLAVLQAAGVEP